MAMTARQDDRYAYANWNSSAAANPQRHNPPQEAPARRLRVIKGAGHSAQHAPKLSLAAVHGFKAAIVVIAVLAVVCLVRVFASVSTVQALEASASLQTQIEEARATGNELEIQHSVLSNPTSIQKKAAKMGMKAPKSTERIVVAVKPSTKTFANGSISIAATVKSITDYAASK